ncbi:MAG: HD domain-containing protein, partial [Blautia sp.]|nr:HD domain-containing protein [Blautia sp.]
VASRNIAKRYSSAKNHIQGTTALALALFDGTKKVHGMGQRERLLLRIAVQLHDTGKYISIGDVAENSYQIIMSTEIIGLSTEERQIIAAAVRYNNAPFDFSRVYQENPGMSADRYLLVAKLTAILRLANALDRSHYQKIKGLRTTMKDRELTVTMDSDQDVSLELGLLADKVAFFEEIFGVRLVLRRKKLV